MIMEAIELYGEDYLTPVTMPGTKKLHNVNENSPKLNKDKSKRSHSMVAKLLFNMKRSRPYLEISVSFYTTRLLNSLDEDWDKIGRAL